MPSPNQERPVRFRVGSIELSVVSDGHFYQDAGVVMGIVPRTVWEPLIGPPGDRNLLPIALNCLVIRTAGRTVLVDTGIGNKLDEKQRTQYFPGDYGYLLGRLRSLGVRPEEIDAVVNSHLHFDHCGWNTVLLHGAAQPTFANATYYIRAGELHEALHPSDRTKATYLSPNFAPLEESGRLHLVDGELEIAPGVHLIPSPGHTADHQCITVSSGGERAIYVGDLVQHGVQLERDPWISATDVLPIISLETKKSILGRAAAENTLVISPHAAFPGAGRFVLEGNRRRFVPAEGLPDHG